MLFTAQFSSLGYHTSFTKTERSLAMHANRSTNCSDCAIPRGPHELVNGRISVELNGLAVLCYLRLPASIVHVCLSYVLSVRGTEPFVPMLIILAIFTRNTQVPHQLAVDEFCLTCK
jgi:hypothetical protein